MQTRIPCCFCLQVADSAVVDYQLQHVNVAAEDGFIERITQTCCAIDGSGKTVILAKEDIQVGQVKGIDIH